MTLTIQKSRRRPASPAGPLQSPASPAVPAGPQQSPAVPAGPQQSPAVPRGPLQGQTRIRALRVWGGSQVTELAGASLAPGGLVSAENAP